jgi:hypothetical protein
MNSSLVGRIGFFGKMIYCYDSFDVLLIGKVRCCLVKLKSNFHGEKSVFEVFPLKFVNPEGRKSKQANEKKRST